MNWSQRHRRTSIVELFDFASEVCELIQSQLTFVFMFYTNFVVMDDLNSLLKITDSTFYGIYSYKNSIYRMLLEIPQFPMMKHSKVKILRDLRNFAFEFNDESDDITEFLTKFHLAMDTYCDEKLTLHFKRENLLAQLTSLDRNDTYDILVAADMSTIKFSNKNHYLILTVNDEMTDFIVSDHSLPDIKGKWFNSPAGTIQGHLNEFTKTLEQMEEYFRNLNTIDQLCFVVDPVDLSTKLNWRVFKIDEKCYVKVEIDPMTLHSVVTFIGPTSLVEKYRTKYDEGMSKWDNDLDIHKNLLKIFGLVYFPVKIDHDDEDELSCSICGMFRIPSIPMITCDNTKCDLIFHGGCLKQWCSMAADGKMFLDVELGAKCPMCKTKISTNFF